MSRDSKVVKLHETTYDDIPAMMRNAAQMVEEGKVGEVDFVAAVAVTKDGNLECFGWGAGAEPFRVIGAFAAAAAYLGTHKGGR